MDNDTFPISLDSVSVDLLGAYFECQIRGLIQGCKWLSDLICALGPTKITSENVDLTPARLYESIPIHLIPSFLLARSLFDAKEYDHCAQTISRNKTDGSDYLLENSYPDPNPIVYFLYVYSRYMACEKRRANDEVELRRVLNQDSNSKCKLIANRCTKELLSLKLEVDGQLKFLQSDNELVDHDKAYLLYVYGLICLRLGMEDDGTAFLVRAVKSHPTLWPAWFELVSLIKDKESLNGLKLPSKSQAWMRYFFEAKVFLKLHEGERALGILTNLSNSGFAESQNLQADMGLAYDKLRAMEMAEKQFKQLFTNSPCRLDNVDAYSNVLFVCENSAELAHLAHHCVNLDKYRPETCCVIGNFFSLRGQHDKAIHLMMYDTFTQFYLRSPMTFIDLIDSSVDFTGAYLMTVFGSERPIGHEYMELRNTNAAVHAYRQALVHNRHDFRAWYGLGQMYEMLDLPSFALYCHREAQYLVPTDSRLIVALGEIYEKLDRLEEAKKCYWRAYSVGDIEGSALVRLALCFEQCGESAEAAAAYTEFIKRCERNGVHNQSDLAQAYKYLANFHLRNNHYEDAALAANKCLEFPETREEAKAMLRQITILAGDIELAANEDGSEHDIKSEADCNADRNMENIHTVEPQCDDKNQVVSQVQTPENQPLDLSLGQLLVVLGSSHVFKAPANNRTRSDSESMQQISAIQPSTSSLRPDSNQFAATTTTLDSSLLIGSTRVTDSQLSLCATPINLAGHKPHSVPPEIIQNDISEEQHQQQEEEEESMRLSDTD